MPPDETTTTEVTPPALQVQAPIGTTVSTTPVTPTGSPAGTLNSVDWHNIATTFLYTAAGALFTILENMLPTINFGSATPYVMLANTAIVSVVHLYFSDNAK